MPGRRARAREGRARCRPASPSGSTRCSDRALVEETARRSAELELSLLRPREPEALLDEEAFARRRVHAVLGRALAVGARARRGAAGAARRAARRRARLRPRRARRSSRPRAGREVTALDWAADAVELLRGTPRGTASRSTPCTATGAAFAGRVRPRARRRPALRAAQRRGARSSCCRARPRGAARRAGPAARGRVLAAGRRRLARSHRELARPRLPAQRSTRAARPARPGG